MTKSRYLYGRPTTNIIRHEKNVHIVLRKKLHIQVYSNIQIFGKCYEILPSLQNSIKANGL